MYLGTNDDITEFPPEWNPLQLALAALGTISIIPFVKFPLQQYLGSGYSILTYIFCIPIVMAPIIYLQLRLGSQHHRSILSIISKHTPFLKGIVVAILAKNCILMFYQMAIQSQLIAYMVFSAYRCDRQVCAGDAPFMWSTCASGVWNEATCEPPNPKTVKGPAPEDQFENNMVLSHVRGNELNSPTFGSFPIWFGVTGLNIFFLLFAWILFFLTNAFGPYIYGFILYVLAPMAIIFLFFTIGVGIFFVTRTLGDVSSFFSAFYQQFDDSMHLSLTGPILDLPPYTPVLEQEKEDQHLHAQGIFGMIVAVAWSLQLWTGQYCSMGKFVGHGRRTRHLIVLLVVPVFFFLAQLPTLTIILYTAPAYDVSTLRLHLSKDYAMPLVMMARAYTLQWFHPIFPMIWFFTIYLFNHLSLSLVMLTTVDNIFDGFLRGACGCCARAVLKHEVRARFFVTLILCLVLMPLSLICISRSGIFWIKILDIFLDRLIFVLIPIVGIALLIAYIRGNRNKVERIVVIVLFVIALLILMASYIWWMITRLWSDAYPVYNEEHVSSGYVLVGWLVAALPMALGLPLGVAIALCDGYGEITERLERLWKGDSDEPSMVPRRRASEPELEFEEKHGDAAAPFVSFSYAPRPAFTPPPAGSVNGARNESEEGLLLAGSETGQKAQLLGTAGAQQQPYFGAPVAGNTLDAYARAPPSAYAVDR